MAILKNQDIPNQSTVAHASKSVDAIEIELVAQKSSEPEKDNVENEKDTNECFDGIKRTTPSFVFDVVSPSLDVYSDFSLIAGWYWHGHWKYATSIRDVLLAYILRYYYIDLCTYGVKIYIFTLRVL